MENISINNTIKELQNFCKSYKLPIYGRKAELIERLNNHFER